jgi:hypothetical protein
MNDATYKKLFLHFLQNGFLLPPTSQLPLILPWEASSGEDAKLANTLLFIP